MIYTAEENRRWWNGLSKTAQGEILDKIVECANSPGVRLWAADMMELWERGNSQFTDGQLAALRKWDR